MKSIFERKKSGRRIVVKGKIIWKTQFDDESKQWTAFCNPIGITACGETHSDLVEAVNEATSGAQLDGVGGGRQVLQFRPRL